MVPTYLADCVERDRRRERGADPEVALLEVGHELAAEGREQGQPATMTGTKPATAAVFGRLRTAANSGL